YFETKDLAAPISFASPHIIVGLGSYAKDEFSVINEVNAKDSAFGINVGGGLEFPIAYKKTYFTLEAKLHYVRFDDYHSPKYDGGSPDLPNLSGLFYTFLVGVMFTW